MSETDVSRRAFLRGAAGATAVAGAGTGAGTATAQESGDTTIQVGPGGNYVYAPGTDDAAYVAVGETVTWEWQSDNHNIVVDSQPDGGDWAGYGPVENTGFTHSHTFETKGEYEYFCQPHQNLGMAATLIVNEDGQPPSSGEASGPVLPDSAKTLGIATVTAMVSTLTLAYLFIKYGGEYDEEM
ncbi:halocyanin [Halobacteriales archaeon SW_7_68_16]|nr:MAG: halocyanin [Halobacteriales archaeon SW_7_68_16]